MKKSLWMMALAVLMCACSSDEPAVEEIDPNNPIEEEIPSIPPKFLTLSSEEHAVLQNQTGFAFDLLNEALKQNDNVVIAPQSLATLLAMMANGADGTTLAELTALFGLQPNQLDVLNNLNKMLIKELPALDNNVTVMALNSLWVEPNFTVYDSFKEVLKSTYNAECFTQSLMTWEGVDKFNQWCETNTNGMIKNFLEAPIESLVHSANANYFNGNWQEKFDKANTKKKEFTNALGNKTSVMMMHAKDTDYEYFMNEGLHGIKIPYGNGNYNMIVIMSKNSDKLPVVTADVWNKLIREIRKANVDVSLPKFTLDYKEDITKLLVNIGLSETFGEYSRPDFSKINEKLESAFVIHGAKIEVDEQGSKASGVSLGGWYGDDFNGGPTAEPIYVNFEVNKPFVFVIEEMGTGTIMYAGAVRSLN